MLKKNVVITIDRLYGSGGRIMGQRLSEELGIPYYNEEILKMASEESAVGEQLFRLNDEKAGNNLFFRAIGGLKSSLDVVDFCINDLLALFNYSMVKMERHQVRNVLQQYWKLEPAPNALSYSTYQISVLPGQKYSASSKKVGRFYTVTREKLKDYR